MRQSGDAPWYVEAHQFRIDTTDGIGRPTPEGAHRDGVDFVAVVLVAREGIKGGETRVFEADGKPQGEISFPEVGTVSGVRGRWASPEAFFTFNSFVTPPTISSIISHHHVWIRLPSSWFLPPTICTAM